MFLDENNKIHKQLYLVVIITLIFLASLFTSQKLQADEPGRFGEKPTKERIIEKLNSAVTEGKLSQEEVDIKLEAILSGDFKGKKPGRFGEKPTKEQIIEKLNLAVTEGKLSQEEADIKLEAILLGDFKGKKPGRFGEK